MICKDPEQLEDGACVLGLDVHGKQESIQWKRGAALPELPDALARRGVFSLCGILVGHLLVCGWLRIATGIKKRRASIVTKGWDEETANALLIGVVAETITRVKKNNPAKGDWCVQGKAMNVWVDASSLAIGILLEKNGAVIEDTCWLRPMNDAAHINPAELDAVLNGINLALQWGVKILRVRTNSLYVYHWVSDTLSGKARV